MEIPESKRSRRKITFSAVALLCKAKSKNNFFLKRQSLFRLSSLLFYFNSKRSRRKIAFSAVALLCKAKSKNNFFLKRQSLFRLSSLLFYFNSKRSRRKIAFSAVALLCKAKSKKNFFLKRQNSFCFSLFSASSRKLYHKSGRYGYLSLCLYGCGRAESPQYL